VSRPGLIYRQVPEGADQAAAVAEVRELMATKTQEEWLAVFKGEDVCLTPVNSPADAVRDPHVQARGVLQNVPGGRLIRPPFVEASPSLAAAPLLGADTESVLGAYIREE
jgi:alpha-methylacyl-CoA racemase